MPEGHLIHHLARRHEAWLVGDAVGVSSPQGRFPGASTLDGRTLVGVEPWGKHLLYAFEGDAWAHVHLAMRGTFLDQPSPPQPPLRQVRMRIEGARHTVDLIAPGVCELLDGPGRAALLDRLGPDPLRPGADPEEVWRRLTASGQPLGAALMDQAVVAGVGNVLRAESLFLAGLHPLLPADELTRADFVRLWDELVAMMRVAADVGRIATVGDEGRFVYKQDVCGRCGTPVERFDLQGRTAYVCPKDQPAP